MKRRPENFAKPEIDTLVKNPNNLVQQIIMTPKPMFEQR